MGSNLLSVIILYCIVICSQTFYVLRSTLPGTCQEGEEGVESTDIFPLELGMAMAEFHCSRGQEPPVAEPGAKRTALGIRCTEPDGPTQWKVQAYD